MRNSAEAHGAGPRGGAHQSDTHQSDTHQSDTHQGDAPGSDHGEYVLVQASEVVNRVVVEGTSLADGLVHWAFETAGGLGDVAVSSEAPDGIGRVFVAVEEPPITTPAWRPSRVIALRASDGAVLWTCPSRWLTPWHYARLRLRAAFGWVWEEMQPVAAWERSRQLDLRGQLDLSAAGPIVRVGTDRLYGGLDARTGAVMWARPRPFDINAPRLPLFGHDLRTGRRHWSKAPLAAPLAGHPEGYYYVDGPRVYALAAAGTPGGTQDIQTIDIRDGSVLASLRLRRDGERLAGFAAGGVAYVVRDRHLSALRISDGEQLWRAAPVIDGAEPGVSAATDAGGDLVVCAYARHGTQPNGGTAIVHVDALDTTTGETRWQWSGAQSEWEYPRRYLSALRLLVGGSCCVVVARDVVYGLSMCDGALRWQAPAQIRGPNVGPYVVAVGRAGQVNA